MVTVTDNNNCSTTDSIQITQPTPLSANINGPSIVCYSQDFQLFANANGGTLPYSFNWFGEINATGQGPINDTLTAPAQYNLVVTDFNGCQSPLAFHLINVWDKPEFTIVDIDICLGDTGILIPTNIIGGNPSLPLYFNWMEIDSSTVPPTDTLLGISNVFSAAPTDTTNYIVYINNICSLSDTLGVSINVNICTNISEIIEANDIQVYPNPTTGIINFELNQKSTSPLIIEVIDLKGKIIQKNTIKTNKSTIDISNLPKGTYILSNRTLKLRSTVILE